MCLCVFVVVKLKLQTKLSIDFKKLVVLLLNMICDSQRYLQYVHSICNGKLYDVCCLNSDKKDDNKCLGKNVSNNVVGKTNNNCVKWW